MLTDFVVFVGVCVCVCVGISCRSRTSRSNASLCLGKLDRWREAIAMADIVLRIDPNHPKALFRRGEAWLKLGEYRIDISPVRDPGGRTSDRKKT